MDFLLFLGQLFHLHSSLTLNGLVSLRFTQGPAEAGFVLLRSTGFDKSL